MNDRIHWRCPCGNLLSAPAAWGGRPVRCPACGAGLPVPAASEPAARDEALALEGRWRERRSPLAADPAQVPPYSAWELRAEGGPPPDDPFFHRFRVDPAVARRKARRGWWVAAGIATLVVLLAGGGLLSRHLWKTRWSAGARMERAGFGQRLDPARAAAWQRALAIVDSAERKAAEPDAGRAEAEALRDAFQAALPEAGNMPRGRRIHLYNNAAWFLVTTPHADLRDPARALQLASDAVEWSGRRDPGVLDTLAEALFASGRPAAASEVEDEARAKEPGNEFYFRQAARFRLAAGLPPPAPVAPAGTAPGVDPGVDPGTTGGAAASETAPVASPASEPASAPSPASAGIPASAAPASSSTPASSPAGPSGSEAPPER